MCAWGAIGAVAIAAPANTAIEDILSEDVALVWGPAISAPLVEEVAKGVALLVAFLVSRRLSRRSAVPEFDGPTDGMVYGAAVGLGFAFAENNWYFLQSAYDLGVSGGLGVLDYREGFLNLNTLSHAVYTGTFGAALGLAFWSRSTMRAVGVALFGLLLAALMHAIHNGLQSLVLVREVGLAQTADAFAGRPLPGDVADSVESAAADADTALQVFDYLLAAAFVAALVLFTLHQRGALRRELAREVASGAVSDQDAAIATSLSRRAATYLGLMRGRRWDELRRLRAANRTTIQRAFESRRRRELAEPRGSG
jgi:hypothetical protein